MAEKMAAEFPENLLWQVQGENGGGFGSPLLLLPSYNSLTDRHLSDYFCRPRIRRHLIRAGLINRHHEIISEAAYKMNMVRKEHKRRIKQMLTDAVVTKSVDLARCKEMKLQRRLEEISKIEAVKKVKDDNMKTSDYQNTYLSSQAAHGILDTQNSRPVSAPEPPSSSKKFLHLEGSKPKHGRKLKKRILPQYVVRPKSAAMPQTHPYGYHPANLAFTPHPPDFLKPVYDKEMDPVPVGKDGTAIVKMNNVDTQVYPYLLAPTPPTSPPPDTPPYTSTSPKRTVRSMQGLPLSDRPGENDQDSGFICATCKSRNLALVNKGVNTYHSQQKPFSDDHDEESFPKSASTLTEQNLKIIDPGGMHDKKQQTDNEIKAELEILGSTMDFQQQTDENVLHTAQQTDKETTKDILIITHDSTQQTDGDVEADSGEVPCSTDDVSSENIQSKHEKHSIEKEILGVCDQVVDKVFKEIVAKKEQLSDSSYLLLNDDNFTATMSAKKIYDITPCIFDKNKICVRTTQHIYSISNKEQYSKYAKIKKNGELHSDFHSDNLYLIQDSGDLPVELNTVVQKKITGPISQKTIVGKSVENLQNVMKRSSDDDNLQNQPILKLTAILKQTSLEHSYIPQNEFRKPAETMMNKDKREESKEMNIDKDSAAYFDEVNSDKNIDAMCDRGRISAILKKSDESIEIPVRKFSGTVETIPNTKKKRLVYTNKNLLENDDKAISGLKKEAMTKDRDSDAIILTQEKYYQNEDEMQKIQNVPNKYSKLESTDKAVTKDNIREIPINQIDTFSNIVAKDNIREIPINQIDTLASLVTKDNIREVPINQIDTFSNVVAKDNIREVPINQIDSEKMPLMTENVDSNKIPFQDSESYLKLVYDNQYLSEAADKEVSVLHSNGSKLGTKNKKDDISKDVVDTSWKENNLEEQLIYGETDSEKEIHRIIPIQQIEETNINIDDDNLNLPKKTVKTLDAKNKPLVKVTTILKNVDLADIPQNKIEMDRDKMKFDKSMPESKVSDNSEYKSVKDIPDSQSEFFTGDQDLTDGCYRVVPIHQINTTELESNLEMKDFQDFEKKPETQTDVGSKVDLIQENGFKVEKKTTKQPTMKVTANLKKKPEEKSSIKDSFTNGQSVTKGMHRIIPIQDVDGEKTGIMDKSEMKPLTGDRGGVRKGICRVIPIRDGEGIVRDYIVIKDEYELTKPMYSNSPIDNDYETIEDKVTNSDIESITDTNKKTSFQSIESYLKEVYSDHCFFGHKYGATIGKNSKMNTDISSDENISDSKCENKQHTMKISSVLKKTTNDYEEIFQVAPIRDRENSTVSEDEKKNIKERCQKKGSNEIQETRYSDSQVIQQHSEDYDKGDTKNSVVIITSVLKKNDNAEEISGTNFRDEKKYGSEVDRSIQIKQISELTDAQYQTGKEKSSEFDTAKNTTVIHSSIRDILIEQPGAIYEKSQSLVGSGKNALYKDLDSQQNQLVEIKKTMNIKDAEILTTEDSEPFVQKDSQISSESVESYIKHTYSNVILSRMKDDVNETSDIYSSEPLKNKESENSKKKHLNRQFIPQDQYTMQITSNLKKKHSIPGEVFHLDPPTASERKPEVINSDLKDVKEKIQLKDSKLHQLDQKGLNGVSSDAKDVVEQSPLIKITSILQRAGDISQNEIKDVELVKDTDKSKNVSGTHFEDEKKHCNKVERRIQIKQISELTDAQYQAGKEKPSEFDTAKNTTVVHSSVRDILIEQPGAIYEKSQSLVGSGKNALYKDLDSQQNQFVEIKKTMNIKDAEILTTEDSEPFVQKDAEKQISSESVELHMKHVYNNVFLSRMTEDVNEESDIYSSESNLKNKESKNSKKKILYSESVPQDQSVMKITSVLKKKRSISGEILNVEPATVSEVNREVINSDLKDVKEESQLKSSELHHLDQEDPKAVFSDTKDDVEQLPLIKITSILQRAGDISQNEIKDVELVKDTDKSKNVSGTHFEDEKKHCNKVERRIQIKQISELTDAQYQAGKEKSSEFDTAKNTTVIHSSVRDILIEQPGAIYEKSQSLVGSGKNALYKDLDSQQNQFVEIKKTMNIKDAEILTTEDSEPFVQKDAEKQISSESVELHMQHVYNNVFLSRMTEDVNEASDIYSSESNLKNKESKNSKKKILYSESVPQDQSVMKITSVLKKKRSISGEILNVEPATVSEVNREVINSDLKDVKKESQLKSSELHHLDQEDPEAVFSDTKYVVEQSPLIKITSILQKTGSDTEDISQNEIENVEPVKDTERSKEFKDQSAMKITSVLKKKHSISREISHLEPATSSEENSELYQLDQEVPEPVFSDTKDVEQSPLIKITSILQKTGSDYRDVSQKKIVLQPEAIFEKSETLFSSKLDSGRDASYREPDSDILTTGVETSIKENVEKISPQSVESYIKHIYSKVYLSLLTESESEKSGLYSHESDFKNKNSEYSKGNILYSESVPQDQSVMKITSVLKKTHSISREILNVEPATDSDVNTEGINSDLKDVKEESQLKSSELHHLDQEDPEAVFSDTKYVVEQSPLIKITSILQKTGSDTEDISQNEIENVEPVKDTERSKEVSETNFESKKKHDSEVEGAIQINHISELTDTQYQGDKDKSSEFDTAENTTVLDSSNRDVPLEQPEAIYEKSESFSSKHDSGDASSSDLDSQDNQFAGIKETMNAKDPEILTTEDIEPFIQEDVEQTSLQNVEPYVEDNARNNAILFKLTDGNEASDIHSSESNLQDKEKKHFKRKIIHSESVPHDQSDIKIISVLRKTHSITDEILYSEPVIASVENNEVSNSELKDINKESQLKDSELHQINQKLPEVFSDTNDVQQSPVIDIASTLPKTGSDCGDISQNEIENVEFVKDTEESKKVSFTNFEDEMKNNIVLSELKDSSELDQTHNYEGDDKLNHELSDDSTSAANQAVPNI